MAHLLPTPTGFAWGRHRQLRTPPSTLSLQDVAVTTSKALEEEDPLTDDDVDCDMLANAGNDGIAIGAVPDGPVGWRLRRRAVMEKGIRAVRPFDFPFTPPAQN
jgi:alpha 1,2-mannosyltransferase